MMFQVTPKRPMQRILAIDPGPTQSALVQFDESGDVEWARIMPNQTALSCVGSCGFSYCVIEGIESFGMAVGAEVFETVFWSGRFAQQAVAFTRVYRKEVKLHFCGSMRAKDANIRQAIIDRFGGKEKAIGRKANQGPLYGIKSHCWSALAVGLCWLDKNRVSV